MTLMNENDDRIILKLRELGDKHPKVKFALSSIGITGAIVFFILFGFFVLGDRYFPDFQINKEFQTNLHPYAICGCIFLSITGILATIPLYERRNALREFEEESRRSKTDFKLAIFTVVIWPLLLLICSYMALISIPAYLLHLYSNKQPIRVEVRATELNQMRGRNIDKRCRYHLKFDSDQINTDYPFICLSENEAAEFMDIEFPLQVVVEGVQSKYGYQLKLGK